MNSVPLQHRLILALDTSDATSALALVQRTRGTVGTYKVGLELFTAVGPSLMDAIRNDGARIFLDIKLHDIPNTVAGAVRAASRHGVDLLTVHALGGPAMLAAAQQAIEEVGASRTRLLAVTVLTSMDGRALQCVGVDRLPDEMVVNLAALASRAGLHGCVCSPQEVSAVRRGTRAGFAIVTPGIRPAAQPAVAQDDQSRTATAYEAIRDGADYVVVGRPIRMAPDPAGAASRLLEEIAAGLEARA